MDIKNVLRSAFPFIATAASIGGPLGTMAANAVGSALGVNNVPATADGISDAIAASKDPDVLVKIKQAEQDFQVKMQQLGFDDAEKLAGLAEQDRASARQREETVKDSTPRILAYVVVLLTLFFEGVLMFYGAPKDLDPVVLGRIMGTLDSAVMLVLSYYFGSSASSVEKNQLLFASTPAAAKAATK